MFTSDITERAIGPYHFRRLFFFRSVVIAVELAVLLLVVFGLGVNLPIPEILSMMAVYAVFNLLAWVRLRTGASASELEFFLHLSVDVLMLAVLFYFSGDSSNPFVSLFLLPLVIVAATLSRRYVWSMAAVALSCYTLLMVIYVPASNGKNMLMAEHSIQSISGFRLHVLGMWFSFLLGVGVILFFVTTMAEALRQRDQKLSEVREKYLRDEHVIGLGTMAAGAAHELGTPLGTIAVLTKEMEREYGDQPELLAQVEILRSQVDRCKVTLAQLSTSAGQLRAVGGHSENVESYLQDIIARWQDMHPETYIMVRLQGNDDAPMIVVDETLKQAFTNLLNNAVDASPKKIEVNAIWSSDELKVSIRDFGSGLSYIAMQEIGKPFFTTKMNGHGLGFYLAQAVVSRLGGTLDISNDPEGGACIVTRLPLSHLKTG